MFTSLSGELNELAIYEAGYQLSLFDSMLPDFVADVHPLVGISPDALYAAAMARPFQDDCSVSGPQILRRIGSDA